MLLTLEQLQQLKNLLDRNYNESKSVIDNLKDLIKKYEADKKKAKEKMETALVVEIGTFLTNLGLPLDNLEPPSIIFVERPNLQNQNQETNVLISGTDKEKTNEKEKNYEIFNNKGESLGSYRKTPNGKFLFSFSKNASVKEIAAILREALTLNKGETITVHLTGNEEMKKKITAAIEILKKEKFQFILGTDAQKNKQNPQKTPFTRTTKIEEIVNIEMMPFGRKEPDSNHKLKKSQQQKEHSTIPKLIPSGRGTHANKS